MSDDRSEPAQPRVVLPLRWWLLATHLVVLMLPLVALLGSGGLAHDLRAQTLATLHHQGAVVAFHVADEVEESGLPPATALREMVVELSDFLERTKWETLAGIRVVDAQGIVVASSAGPEAVGEVLAADPEVEAALGGISGTAVKARRKPRETASLGSPSRRARVRIFHAVPIDIDGHVIGAVVLSRTPREELQALYQMGPVLWASAGISVLVTLALGAGLSWLFSRSLRALALASPGLVERPGDAAQLLARPRRSHVEEVADVARALEATAERLQDRLGYITEFAGNVSHEFKTPLSTLKGTLELIADDPDMPVDQRRRFLANAEGELERLSGLVGGLLALARAEESGALEVVELEAIARQVAGRHPRTSVEGRFALVQGDPRQLSMVLDNLVSNAHRHGGEGGSVRILGAQVGDRLRVSVVDDGVGISEGNQARVFERFFTTRRGEGGVGLGLSLVAAVVRAHHGTVEVSSQPGQTRFTLDLPRHKR